MIITHPGCDARWSGLVVEHCPACHLTFSGTEAGDEHRVGTHGVAEGPRRRRCLTVAQMRAKTVCKGTLAGEPWFAVKVNAYGTEVWSRNQQDTRWGVGQQDSDGLTGVPVYDRVRTGVQAVYEPLRAS